MKSCQRVLGLDLKRVSEPCSKFFPKAQTIFISLFCRILFPDVTPGGSPGLKKVVTRTEVRTVRTVNGKVIQDDLETRQYGHDRSLTNGHPSRGYASADEYGPRRRYGSRSGYSSGEDGRTTPTANGPTGYMSDSYRSPRSQSPAAGNLTFQ